MPARKLFYWIHLIAGLVCGLFIALLAGTGSLLSFETELVAWAEAASFHVEPPTPQAARLPIKDLLARVRETQPGLQVGGITLSADPQRAVVISGGRNDAPLAINPWTGEARPLNGSMRAFMSSTKELHRWLLLGKEARPVGRIITGSATLAFLLLGVTGLLLWWPRQFKAKLLRRITWFDGSLRGRARDWNWHHVFGFWALPLFVVITLSGAVMSFRWAESLSYRMVGDTLVENRRDQPRAGGAQTQAPATEPLALDTVFQKLAKEYPTWKSLSLRFGEVRGAAPGKPAGPAPLMIMVQKSASWPAFAVTMVTINPVSGETTKVETLADQSPGRRLRSWLRYLHTGEALGLLGKSLALLACLSTLILTYTGVALYFKRQPSR